MDGLTAAIHREHENMRNRMLQSAGTLQHASASRTLFSEQILDNQGILHLPVDVFTAGTAL